MRLERGGRDFGIEQLVGIVLAALELGDDHRALRLAVGRVVEAGVHALGLDEQHPVERVLRGGLQVRRLVDPGVAVPGAAELLDDALHLLARDVGGALEVHVLDPVRHAGHARALVACEPTLYQHHTEASGAVCTSWTSTFRPLSRTVSRTSAPAPELPAPERPVTPFSVQSSDTPCPTGKTRQPAAHRLPDEGQPADHRAGDPRPLGRDRPVRADSHGAQGRAEVHPARRSARTPTARSTSARRSTRS